RGQCVVEGRGDVPERGAELAVVHDPGVGELVERVEVFTHRRLDESERSQCGGSGREAPGLVAGEPVDVVDDLSGGAGFGDGQVPCRTGGAGLGGQGNERGGDIGRVRVAVRLIGVAHDLGGAATK